MLKRSKYNAYYGPCYCERCERLTNWGEVITLKQPNTLIICLDGSEVAKSQYKHICPECYKELARLGEVARC